MIGRREFITRLGGVAPAWRVRGTGAFGRATRKKL